MPVNRRLLAAAALRQQQQQAGQLGARGVQVSQLAPQRAQAAQAKENVAQQAAQAGMSRTALIMQQKNGGAKPPAPGGVGGFLGGILGNRVVQTALKPLEVFDVPRRVVISGVNELADALNGGDASWQDFGSQVQDSSFGFGDVVGDINTGNDFFDKWSNRAVGLAGDIALDPLTYLTLGASKIPGATGRVALARAAEAAGLDREIIDLVGRKGGNAITDIAQREAIGLKPQIGMEFMGQHIPGTGTVTRGLSGAINTVKPIDSKMAQRVRQWGVSRDPELRAMMERLATGRGEIGGAEAARQVAAVEGRRKAQRKAVGMFENDAIRVGDTLGDNAAYTEMMERGVDAPEIAPWRRLEEQTRLHAVNKEGASVGFRENRVPHKPTPKGEEILGKSNIRATGGAVDPTDPTMAQYSRQIVPGGGKDGTYTIGGQQFTPVTGTIKEINDWAATVGLPKLYEDSPKYLAALTVEQSARQAGSARFVSELTKPGRYRMAYGLQDNFASENRLNEAASLVKGKAQAESVAPYMDVLKGKRSRAETAAQGTLQTIKDDYIKQTKTELAGARKLDQEARGELNKAIAAMDKLGSPQEMADAVNAKADELMERATAKLERAREAVARVDERIARFEETASGRMSRAYAAATKERDALLKKLEDAKGIARERDIYRKRLNRATARQPQLEEALAGLLPVNGIDPVQRQAIDVVQQAERPQDWMHSLEEINATTTTEVPVKGAKPRPAPVAPKAPEGQVIAGKLVPAKQQPVFDRMKATLDGAVQKWQEATTPQAKQLAKLEAEGAKRELDGWFATLAPPPAAVAEAAPAAPVTRTVTTPAIPPNQVSPLEEQIAGILAEPGVPPEQLAKAQSAVAGGQQKVNELTKVKGKLDTKFEKTAADRAIDPAEAEARVAERMQPVDAKIEGQRAELVAKREERVAAADELAGHMETLNDDHDGALNAIRPLWEQAGDRQAETLSNSLYAEQNVKQATATSESWRRRRTVPEKARKGVGVKKRAKTEDWQAVVETYKRRTANDYDLFPASKFISRDLPREVQPKTLQLLRAAEGVTRSMAKHDADINEMSRYLKKLRSGELTPVMERVAKDGYEFLATDRVIGRDLYVRTEMKRAMDNFVRQAQKEPGAIGQAIDTYTKFFKTYATATPGFHIRNALSATFMNMTEGVGGQTMRDGVTIWQAFRKNPSGDWVSSLPTHLQANAEDVVEAVYGSGAGGRFSAEELSQRAYADRARKPDSKLVENRLTKRSQNYGERVEGGVRAGLALHVLNEGGTPIDAVTRIKRIHFDYSDVNETDQAVRRVIPFWTFMSRSLPLQVQQMWMKPRTYAQYNSLKRNFDDDPDDTQFMPEYMQAEGGFFLGQGVGISPDIGASQIDEQLNMLADPKRLLSNVNPGFKVPLELATNRDFFYNEPYKENDYTKMGWDTRLLAPLLQAVGMAESTPQGPVIEQKYMNAIYDLVPSLGQVNRMASTTENREGKGWQSAANYVGIPLRLIDEDAKNKNIEYLRRQSRRQDPNAARLEALRQFG